MNTRRVVILITCVVVAALALAFVVSRWDQANRIATVASALATVAAVGVAVWAALPGSGSAARAIRTGTARARGLGARANSGISATTSAPGGTLADRTGEARATDGGSANSGVDLRP
jgi:cytosine/uracil/thiamine/allantoin permease